MLHFSESDSNFIKTHDDLLKALDELEFRTVVERERPWSCRIRDIARKQGVGYQEGLLKRIPYVAKRSRYFPGALSMSLGARVTPYNGFLPFTGPSMVFWHGLIPADSPDVMLYRANMAWSYMGW